jgi:hypothetical protein
MRTLGWGEGDLKGGESLQMSLRRFTQIVGGDSVIGSGGGYYGRWI